MSPAVARDSADGLKCRLYQKTDLPGLLRLWESHSDWGSLTEEAWNSWYRDTPYGDSIIAVTSTEDGEVVGQLIFIPSRVRVLGKEIPALRMSAPIFARPLRSGSLKRTGSVETLHPVLRMYLTGVREAISRGIGIVYSFPTYRWIPVWRSWNARGELVGRAFDKKFPCLAVPITEEKKNGRRTHGMSVSIVEDVNEQHVALWLRACRETPVVCAVERTVGWLNYNRGDALIVEARRDDGTLSGYAVVRRNGLLADFYAGSPSEIFPVLESITEWLVESRAAGTINFKSFKIMDTPELGDAGRRLGGVRVSFEFAFVGVALSAHVPDVAVDAASWYLTPGD